MTEALDMPVALFVFARPDLLARVLASVRTARPRLVLVVADGPRPDYPQDVMNCRATLEIIESIDWPCEIRRCVAERNMGCSIRLTTGLDWIFRQVPEAIILEDDIVPDPSFFPWCAAMLRRYRDRSEIMHVSGRNELGRWGSGASDHLVARRGNVWGWASWARAWFAVDRSFRRPEIARGFLDRLALDPLLAADLTMQLELMSSGRLSTWDTRWSVGKALAGGLSIVPPVNLVANIGFDDRAVHCTDEGDLRAALPHGCVETVAPHECQGVGDIDSSYDRGSLLLALMATYRNPALARRLAKFQKVSSHPRLGAGNALAHHLAPFANPAESIAVLDHLLGLGTTGPRIAALRAAMSEELDHRHEQHHG